MSSVSQKRRVPRRVWLVPVLVLWTIAVIAGLGRLIVYANDPGPVGAPSASWPAESRLPRSQSLPTLLVFTHPQCPCSRASVAELARLMAAAGGRVATHVVMYRPAGEPADWARTDLWKSAAAIPGVDTILDDDGRESRRFGVSVSGHALLYDASGRLLFSGGMTSARGHEGDNAGRDAITSLILTGNASIASTRTFGCFIHPGASK